LAESQGYIRLFADEGVPMTRLLTALKVRQQQGSTYLQTLLAACRGSLAASAETSGRNARAADTEPNQRLVDPLSEREVEVLHLLALGASNAEVAERLVVATSTAKYHVKNILAKLAATNRTQAVARARELDLL
jgi:LuxR family maltose regulon positive regulatory protein